MNLNQLVTKVREKAHCIGTGDSLSIKGEAMLGYLDRALNGEITEKNRIQEYEDLIEWYVMEDQSDRYKACKDLKNIFEEMWRPWKE